jgi:CheY-like chemotaxis protein
MQTILIIEDNVDYRINLAELLQIALYHTLEAENGLIGLAMIGAHLPNLILCDIDMPIMSGVEMLILMKQDSRISRIPIVFITGHTDELTRKNVIGLGGDLCLAKTVSIDVLIKLIHGLLNAPTVQ